MNEYEPKSLPDITAVEIADLRGIDADRVMEYMDNADNAASVRCGDQRAKYIAKVWRALPRGSSTRCHTPPIGIRFFNGESLICEASICWRCENIFGYDSGKPISYCFSSQSTAGQELFLAVQELIGTDVLGDG